MERTVVDGVSVIGSLSPSRASDFMTCPLLYRFRVVDRIPETPSSDAVRGTLVHAVLEDLFDAPAPARTLEQARSMVAPAWDRLKEAEPQVEELFKDGADLAQWLESAGGLLASYFALEDPRRLEPAEREKYVETVIDGGLLLRGYVDRVDVAPTGEVRVVDYKTGKAPREFFEAKALFQMKFYALVMWRTTGTIPTLLQLMYLGNEEVLRYSPDEQDLLATERKLRALWTAIERASTTGEWRPNKSVLCGWCDHKARCPEWGGTLPPLPERETLPIEPAVMSPAESPAAAD